MSNNFDIFKDKDIYSLCLFVLYKLTDIPEYTTLSELSYILDKDNMLKFCQYFGGSVIRVPTISELESTMSLLLLYQYVNIEGLSFDDAAKKLNYDNRKSRKLRNAYNKVCKVLKEYDIKPRKYHQ